MVPQAERAAEAKDRRQFPPEWSRWILETVRATEACHAAIFAKAGQSVARQNALDEARIPSFHRGRELLLEGGEALVLVGLVNRRQLRLRECDCHREKEKPEGSHGQ